VGHALIVLVVSEEQLALGGLRTMNEATGAIEPLPQSAQWKPQAFETTVQEHPEAFWLLPVHPADVWWLPEEPRKEHGGDWHFDPKLLATHVEKVRGSLESFLNAKLEQLDDMARSGQECRKVGDLIIGLHATRARGLLSGNIAEHRLLHRTLGYALVEFPVVAARGA
jgi:hypothetical protein